MQTTLFGVHSKRPFLAGADLSPDGQYRYSLWRIFDTTKSLVLFIGLNPSTADATEDDATIRRLNRFVQDWGYGGYYVANLFCYRTKDVGELLRVDDPVGALADKWLAMVAAKCDRVIFCWGCDGAYMGRDQQVIAQFPTAFCLGLTAGGHPRHPLYLPAKTQLQEFGRSGHLI